MTPEPVSRPWRRHHDDREIVRLALPALGALVAEPLYLLTDTAVVGRLGTPQLGGLAVAGTLLATTYGLFIFLAYGTTAAVARRTGAGDRGGGAALAVQSVWLALVLGAVVAVAGVAAAGPAVDAMGASDAVRPHALTYLRISALGAPAFLVGLACVGYLRGIQDTAGPLRIALAANAVNLVAELVCIYGLGFGLAASAWTTVAAQVGAAVVFLRRLGRATGAAGPGISRSGAAGPGISRSGAAGPGISWSGAAGPGISWRPDPAAMLAVVRVGGALFVRTASLLAALAAAGATAARLGTAEVAAHQIAFGLWSFLALVLDALAIAAQAMVGSRLGAGDAPGARDASRRMLQWGVGAGVAFAAGVIALRPFLPGLFTDDPAVRAEILDVVWFVALLQPVNAVVFVLDGVLIGAGDLRFLARAMVGALVAFLPACVLVAAAGWPLGALWGALGVLMGARFVAVVRRFRGTGWAVTGATVG